MCAFCTIFNLMYDRGRSVLCLVYIFIHIFAWLHPNILRFSLDGGTRPNCPGSIHFREWKGVQQSNLMLEYTHNLVEFWLGIAYYISYQTWFGSLTIDIGRSSKNVIFLLFIIIICYIITVVSLFLSFMYFPNGKRDRCAKRVKF